MARLVLDPVAKHSLELLREATDWYLLADREKDLKRPLGRGGLKEKFANSSSWSCRRIIPKDRPDLVWFGELEASAISDCT